MKKYLLRRFLQAIPILFGVSIMVFLLAHLAPGDPVDALIPPNEPATPGLRALLRAQMGLNKPLPVQYIYWLGRAVTGNFGYSYTSGLPVSQLIAQRLPATLTLVGFALVTSLIVGVIAGIIAAVKQDSLIDYVLAFLAFAALSVPGFFLGLAFIYVFAVKLNWFPAFGISSPGSGHSLGNELYHLILPGTALGLELIAGLSRYVRSSLLEVLETDYMRTARAKGLRESVIVFRHGLSNALIPVITIVSLRLPMLFGGAVVIETVFQWPGIGLLTLNAAHQRDYNLLMALGLLTAVIVMASNLLADVAYAFADPRIRYD